MRKEQFGKVTIYQGDCMELMAGLGDKAFDLAVVDPPYGIGIAKNPVRQAHEKTVDNAIPEENYFKELCRASKNQIIWGGNYFLITWETLKDF